MTTSNIAKLVVDRALTPSESPDLAAHLDDLETIGLRLRMLGCLDHPIDADEVYRFGRRLDAALVALRLVLE